MSLSILVYFCIGVSQMWLASTVNNNAIRQGFSILWLVCAFIGLIAQLSI